MGSVDFNVNIQLASLGHEICRGSSHQYLKQSPVLYCDHHFQYHPLRKEPGQGLNELDDELDIVGAITIAMKKWFTKNTSSVQTA